MAHGVVQKKALFTGTIKAAVVSLALFAAAPRAWASYVFKDTSRGDSRLVMANTTFSNVIDRAISGGLWVRDITEMDEYSAIYGCAHVNTGASQKLGFVVMFQNNNSLRFTLYGKKADGTSKNYASVLGTNDISWCTDGKWHFIMFTCDCDAGVAKLYLDGTCLTTLNHELVTIKPERLYAFGGGMAEVTEPAAGKSPSKVDYGAGMLGYFAEATVWNRALTDAEVAELATRRVRYDAEGLIAYWPCNESAGNPVNWAKNAATRADGTEVQAYARSVGYVNDPDFFSMPSGYFVVTPEWAAAHDYVMADGCAANTLAKPATNIQYALDKATTDGKTVNLLPGVYRPSAKLLAKCNSLVLRSYNPETDDYDRKGTVLDGSELASGENMIFDNNGKTKPEINSLTFCNTTAARGVYCKSAGAFMVFNCSFTNLTTASGSGGGIHAYTSNGGIISNCLFRGCSGTGGGGIYTIQNAFGETDRCTVMNCQFEGCKATKGNGGGVCGDRCIRLFDCTFADNLAQQGNPAKGGHLFCGYHSMVSGCTFGGSATAEYGSCIFTANGQSDAAGAATITNCLFTGATSGGGWGYIHPCGQTQFVNCIVTNNAYTAQFVFVEGSRNVLLRQCLFANNTRKTIVTGHNGVTRIENCTSAMDGTVCDTSSNYSTNTFVNCAFLGKIPASSGQHCNIVSNCCVAAPAPGGAFDSNVVTKDPKFVDAEHGDYSLKHSSPCRDKALFLDWMTAAATDLAGNPRVVTEGQTLAENPNAKPDMGAFECLLKSPGILLLFR